MGKYNYFDDEYEKNKAEKIKEKVTELRMDKYYLEKAKDWFNGLSVAEIIRPKSKEQKRVNTFIVILLILLAFVIIIVGFGTLLAHHNELQTNFEKEAGKICNGYIAEYGDCKYQKYDEKHKDFYKMTGLSFARQLDFNGDGQSELLVSYQYSGVYVVEVWGYNKKDFVKLYSGKANYSKNDEDGSWITLQKDGDKYLIGESNASDTTSVTLLGLDSSKFKEKDSVKFNVAKDSFSTTKGKDISKNFEVIHISYIEERDALRLVDIVESVVDGFSTNVESEQTTVTSTKQLTQTEAYYDICQKYITKYGEPEIESNDGYSSITGLAVVKEIDFNADGKNELFIIYEAEKSVATADEDGDYTSTKQPCYTLEVYAWDGKTANRVFEDEGLCQYYNDYNYEGEKNKEVFYMLKNADGKVGICTLKTNMDATKYDTGKVSSSVRTFNGTTFKTSYSSNVVKNYGYATYSVNGENVYSDEFYSNGYEVPYFYGSQKESDKTTYVKYLVKAKSINASELKTVPDETKETINALKK